MFSIRKRKQYYDYLNWQMRSYFSSPVQYSEIQKLEQTRFDGPIAEVAIYQSDTVTDKNSRHPETVVARFLAQALDRIQVNYSITYGYGKTINDTDDRISTDSLNWYQRTDVPYVAKDANMLILNAVGGGLTRVGGKWGVMPGRYITYDADYVRSSTSPLHHNIHDCLHETGHALGSWHDHDSDSPGKQHPGMAWNGRGYWHRTPNVAGNGHPNACGQHIPVRKNEAVWWELWYNECFKEYIDIK